MEQKKVLEQLKVQGYKITPQRRALMEALFNFESPASAKEILDCIRQRFPDIGIDTIYRNLNLLIGLGVVNQINLIGTETSRFEIGDSHHHHLVCLQCGRSVCVDCSLLEQESLNLASEQGFEVVSHAFEIYGYCPDCRQQ
ncbi:MAG: Fur family transcriptional regulator [Bacillota bacterium]